MSRDLTTRSLRLMNVILTIVKLGVFHGDRNSRAIVSEDISTRRSPLEYPVITTGTNIVGKFLSERGFFAIGEHGPYGTVRIQF